ncbi:MAG: MBL fold metallo-hydrolase, partial [Phycisphaerae bacterium]
MHFKAFVEPAFYKNAYVVYRRDHGPCWIIDPGLAPQPEQICAFLQRHDLTPELILLTHGHADHIAGLGPLKQAFTTAKVLISHQDRPMLSDPDLNLSASFSVPLVVGLQADADLPPGARLCLDGLAWQVLDTSGHSPGSRSLYCSSAGLVVVGDALFAGSIGRTDLPGGNAPLLLANIRQHLLSLPDQTLVLPGHGP